MYLFVLQLPAVVNDVYAAIQPLLHRHRLHSYTRRRFFDLIQPVVIGNGKIFSHRSVFPHREDAIKIDLFRDLAVKIGALSWADAKPSIVARQIPRQEAISLAPSVDPS